MNKIEIIDATAHVELGVADDVIGELRTRLSGRKADTHAGYEMVRAGIAEVTKYRTGVGRAGKEMKASAIAFQKKVNSEISRVTDLLLEIEMPLREEKDRVDKEAKRIRDENQAKEHLAIKAREREEEKAWEAEEKSKREADRKEREAENAKLELQRQALEADRKQLEGINRLLEKELQQKNAELAAEREKIEADKRAIHEKARKEVEANEAADLKVQEEEKRAKDAEAEKVRLAREEVERELLAEERKPDRAKLQDFAKKIEAIEPPKLKTAWGNGVFAEMCDYLQSAVDAAYDPDAEAEDDLAAADAAETVSQQSPVKDS